MTTDAQNNTEPASDAEQADGAYSQPALPFAFDEDPGDETPAADEGPQDPAADEGPA